MSFDNSLCESGTLTHLVQLFSFWKTFSVTNTSRAGPIVIFSPRMTTWKAQTTQRVSTPPSGLDQTKCSKQTKEGARKKLKPTQLDRDAVTLAMNGPLGHQRMTKGAEHANHNCKASDPCGTAQLKSSSHG